MGKTNRLLWAIRAILAMTAILAIRTAMERTIATTMVTMATVASLLAVEFWDVAAWPALASKMPSIWKGSNLDQTRQKNYARNGLDLWKRMDNWTLDLKANEKCQENV